MISLNQVVNKKYADVFLKKPRYIIMMGGRGAGRSTVASQFALARLVEDNYFRCAIMRFILTDVRNSIFREIVDRAEEQKVLDAIDVAEQPMRMKYGKNSINAVGFRKSSGDQKSKLKSLANYNCVIVEEADEIPEDDFTQLDDSLRTVKGDITVILLLNPPPKSHWINRRFFDLEKHPDVNDFYIPRLKKEYEDQVLFINTNYKDNIANLSQQTITNYERYKTTKPDHYWNMVVGLVPEVVRGKIYKDWRVIDELPHEARLECYGLDFGFHPDPAAIVAIYYYNGGYILDEVLYGRDYLNRHLATVINNNQKAVVVADSAEPKSIAELKELGVDIIPVEKGRDSVSFGIKKVQGVRVSVTRRSVNIIREYDNYAWKINKEGEEDSIEDPKCDNHAMSAVRYGLSILMPHDPAEEKYREKELAVRHREREENIRQNAGL